MAIMPDRRTSVRKSWNIPVTLCKSEIDITFTGTCVNVNQKGALIKTGNWQCFQANDQTSVICFLPPDLTGQNETLGLRGGAIIRRVDPINEAVAIEFVNSLRQFEPISSHFTYGQLRTK